MTQAYPLAWPTGWTRTLPAQRKRAQFNRKVDTGRGWSSSERVTVAVARKRLADELDRLGAINVTLSTNIELRADGQPRSDRRDPLDPGAAVYFEYAGMPTALACDKWDAVADNIVALSKHIEAMRGMDRWGVGTARQAFAGYAALPAPDPWWKVLGLACAVKDPDAINRAWRAASALAHPDRPGGSHDRMAAVNSARDEGLRLLEGPK